MPRPPRPTPRRPAAPAHASTPAQPALAPTGSDAPGDARPGVGASQREVLDVLKRRGPATVVEALAAVRIAKETLREHLEALVGRGLVVRAGARRGRPGRPEIVYALAPAADAFFPRREGAVLTDLVRHLLDEGKDAELRDFFDARAEGRKAAALERLKGLRGRARLAEVAQILTEDGYMAEVKAGRGGRAAALRLCHCPVRDVVAVTRLPCGAEMAYVRALLGRSLSRIAYLPDGDASCTYRLSPPAPHPHRAR